MVGECGRPVAVDGGRFPARRGRRADGVHHRPAGTHGGYLFLLADATFSYACSIPGTTLAQSAHIVFLRPASVGDELIAEAAERSRFGRIGVYDVSVRRADGTMIAEFRGQSQSVPDNFFRAHTTGPS
jgi:acyl-CoA thioesterase